MSKVETLRAFVNQRLTASAEEIFELFESTLAEYEEELCRLKEENEQQRKLLDAVFNPEVRLPRADVQQLAVSKEEVPPEQQEWSSSLDQEDPDPPHIKEEQKDLWTSQEGEQLQGLEEADIKFPFTSVPVKSKDEEKAQSSQHHEGQTEDNREAEHLKTEADGDDCGGSEPARNADPDSLLQPATQDKTSHSSESKTDDSSDREETGEPRSGLNHLQHNVLPVSDIECNTGKTSISSSIYASSFGNKGHLQKHTGVQTGERLFSCSVCGKRFTRKQYLKKHSIVHTGEKPFSCSVCGKRFRRKENLTCHSTVHSGEKPFNCSVCGKRFTLKRHLRQHSIVHTGEKPFNCSVCGQRFTQKGNLRQHLRVHTGEKPFSCSVCGKRFTRKQHLRTHCLTVCLSSRNK